ncbi:hypothetical protein STENM327S_02471 [Streptomyces tendae]
MASEHGTGPRPAADQQPEWPDPEQLREVTGKLAAAPPLVFPAECETLRTRLAAVARGEALLLQGGDCAETFATATQESVAGKLRTLLQMAVVLAHGASLPVVKVGRMAGQFAKPRSRTFEERDGVRLPSYRGDAVNAPGFTARERTPDPGPHAADVRDVVDHAQPGAGADDRWLRRSGAGARVEPRLRRRRAERVALRTPGRRDPAGARLPARLRGRHPPPGHGRVPRQSRGPAARLRACADPHRSADLQELRHQRPSAVGGGAHAPAGRRAHRLRWPASATRSPSSWGRRRRRTRSCGTSTGSTRTGSLAG